MRLAWVGLGLMMVGVTEAASGMRCGVGLVTEGQYTFEVLEMCGEPAYQHAHVEYRGFDVGLYWVAPVHVEEWVYDLGKPKFRRLLRFEDGRLRRIEILEKAP